MKHQICRSRRIQHSQSFVELKCIQFLILRSFAETQVKSTCFSLSLYFRLPSSFAISLNAKNVRMLLLSMNFFIGTKKCRALNCTYGSSLVDSEVERVSQKLSLYDTSPNPFLRPWHGRTCWVSHRMSRPVGSCWTRYLMTLHL